MEKTDSTDLNLNTVINKALHIMAAHLHRYSSELERLENILREFLSWHESLSSLIELNEGDEALETHIQTWRCAKRAYEQILSQLRAIRAFGREIERKIENILALVSALDVCLCPQLVLHMCRVLIDICPSQLFNQIQVTNDRTMQAILRAAQNEATESHKLALSMKEDSIAMKTVHTKLPSTLNQPGI